MKINENMKASDLSTRVLVQNSGIKRLDLNKLESQRIGKHTLSKMSDLRQAISS
jgi:hypothetical protein